MIDINKFKNDLQYYSDAEVMKKYNLSMYMFQKMVNENKIVKIKQNIRNLNLVKNQISKEDLYTYYILENHTFEETQKYFNITSMLPKLLKEYNIKKDTEKHIKNIKKSKLKKYGDENYNNPLKRAITNTNKYGVDNQFKRVEIFADIIEKKKELYGSANNLAKNWETRIKNYGSIKASYESQQHTYQKTCIDRYQCLNAAKNADVKNKIKNAVTKTFQEKYGCNNYWDMDNAKRSNGSINSKPNAMFKQLLDSLGVTYDIEFKLSNKYYDFKVADILFEINPSPTHNLNWTPWADTGIDINYHKEKSKIAENNNYRCIHIWDWDDIDKIISIVKPKERIYARKCIVKEVPAKDAANFLNTYHLQRYARDSARFGLYYDNKLLQIMTFGKPRYSKKCEYELIRLCSHSDYIVIGGAERLFKYFIDKYNPNSIISYCDRSKFTGNIYKNLGFKVFGNYSPSIHWYNVKTKKHVTDNLLRQRGFNQLFGQEYGYFEKGTSNVALMLEHGFVQVADCGQQRFIWENPIYN